MTKVLWFDCETYSECDLKAHGTHRYAAHPSTEITVLQWALGDDEPTVIDCTDPQQRAGSPLQFFWNAFQQCDLIAAHNSVFDRTLLRHCLMLDIPVTRWYDTMVQAMAHGLPGGLDKVSQIVGLSSDLAKDKRGKELINLFCKPRPKNSTLRRATRDTHPTEWSEFLEYSRQDVIAMRAIGTRLPRWNFREGGRELALWHLDQRINDRGVCTDRLLAESAIAAVATEQARLKAKTVSLTNGVLTNVSQRDKLLRFILAEYDVTLPDLKADTLRRRMEDPELPEAVKLLLSIRLEATKTSTAKYKALVNAVSDDGRLRNTLQFAGAQRTARWAGRIFQPQNLPRPAPGFDGEAQELVVEALKSNCADLVYDDVMQQTANCLRGCIVAPPGKKLVVADLSNIEGRGLAFLAGERWKLKAFAEFDAGRGPDLYNLAYARSFNIEAKQVTKSQRQVGKVQELGLGYEGGVAAFLTFAAVYNMDLEELSSAVHKTASADALKNANGMWGWASKKKRTLGLPQHVYVACEVLKRAWRDAHPNTEALWAAAGDSVRAAILNPGESFSIGEHLKARVDGAWLRIRLPSGRYLCYINPSVNDKDEITYFGVNQYTRQWGKIKTYGGKLVENCTQAFARDIIGYNMPAIEKAGYEIVLTVHDEDITECPNTDEFSSDHLASLMATVPPWAKGIPLAAAGFETYRYRKE